MEQSETGEDPTTGPDGASSGSTASESSGSDTTPGWPELWYGDYYLPDRELDDPQPTIGTATNFTLSESGGTREWLYCDGHVEATAGGYSGDAVAIEFDAGSWDGVLISPPDDEACSELEVFRLHDEGEMTGPFRLKRGRLYVSEECDGDAPIWAVSLDPDTPTECTQ